VARGLFNESLITSQATAKGMLPKTVNGASYFVSTDKNPIALAFPATGVITFGDLTGVEQVLSSRANPSSLSADLQSQIATASQNNDVWFASTVPANNLVGHMPQTGGMLGDSPQKSQVMQAVLQSNGGIRFGTNVQLSFNAQTRSDQDATSLTDLIRFVSSAIQMQRQNDPRAALLAPAMDTMQLRSSGNQVFTSLAIPEADLEQIVTAKAKVTPPTR